MIFGGAVGMIVFGILTLSTGFELLYILFHLREYFYRNSWDSPNGHTQRLYGNKYGNRR